MNSSPEEALFQLALAKPADKRAAFLDVMCKGDPDLRQRFAALLAAHEEPESLAGPSKATIRLQFDDEPAPAEQAGSLVGRYKLLEKLGVGGFGEVWAAEQTEPVERRTPIRRGAGSSGSAHADLEIGAPISAGRPFFVLELVRGIRRTDSFDPMHHTQRARLP